jgi:catabolite repression HPr-like protein
MAEKKIVVMLRYGLHARPATVFVKTATSFASHILISKDGKAINAKSIMGVMSLCITKGDEVLITADGEDEQEAIKAIEKVLISEEEE